MTSQSPITVEWALDRHRGAKAKLAALDAGCQERIPRLARLMALAIKFDTLIRQGIIRDYADLAHLGHVSRARITQIMNLLHLAPDIQEQLLNLRPNRLGHAPICERHTRRIASLTHWPEQRRTWQKMLSCQ